MAATGAIVGLDIGQAVVRAVVGRSQHGRVHVFGVGAVPAAGIARGKVANERLLAESARRALREAATAGGLNEHTPVVVGLGGALWNNETAVAGPEKGLALQQWLSALLDAPVEAVLPSAAAAARAVLLPSERTERAAVLDIGDASTDVVIFRGGEPVLLAVVPVGGRHVTNDIAYGLQVAPEEAERLKQRYGAAVPGEEARAAAGGTGNGGVVLFEIVTARVAELLELAQGELATEFGDAGPDRVIVTGGSALLAGLQQAAETTLGVPVRIGVAQGTVGTADVVTSPAYAGVIGLLYGVPAFTVGAAPADGTARKGFLASVKEWLSDFL